LRSIWISLTDFGDSAVTVPLAALTLIFLAAAREMRVALGWVLAIGGCAIVIGALKLIFGACAHRLALANIVSPSGHTAMSTAVYGSLALLIGAVLPRYRRAIYVGAAIFIGGIAVSRAVLHEHDIAEIVVGLLVGLGAAASFHEILRRPDAPALPVTWFALCALGLVAMMHGTRWIVEPVVNGLAVAVRRALPWCN